MKKIAALVMVVTVLVVAILVRAGELPVSDKESVLITRKFAAAPESLVGKKVKVQALFWRVDNTWLDWGVSANDSVFPSSRYAGFLARVSDGSAETAILNLFISKQKVDVLYHLKFGDKITVSGTAKYVSHSGNSNRVTGIEVDSLKVGW